MTIRVTRAKLQGEAAQHASETEMEAIPDAAFDACIDNAVGKLTLQQLYQRVESLLEAWG